MIIIIECDGACNEHIGLIRKVKVYGKEWTKDNPWIFNYCENAIKIDENDGWIVEIIEE